MFNLHDKVMYRSVGVCEIIDICPKKFIDKEITYYVLQPLFNGKSTIYAPVDSDKVRNLVTKKDIDNILNGMNNYEIEWIDNINLRRETFTNIIKDGNHEQLIKLIRKIHIKKQEREQVGKTLNASDEKVMNEAENLINQEFSYVLKIDISDVFKYIYNKMK